MTTLVWTIIMLCIIKKVTDDKISVEGNNSKSGEHELFEITLD